MASTDELFAQLHRISIDQDELHQTLMGVALTNLPAVANHIYSSELMLRDPENIGDALQEAGLHPRDIVTVLTDIRLKELALKKSRQKTT